MTNTSQIVAFLISFLIVGFFVLSMPEFSYSGNGGTLGCCRTSVEGGECVGCVGECAASQDACEPPNIFEGGLACGTTVEGAFCFPSENPGCCVFSPGNCDNGVLLDSCTGVRWFETSTCSEIRECATPQIPTLNEWGKIITIAVIGLFAVIGIFAMRRRSAVIS